MQSSAHLANPQQAAEPLCKAKPRPSFALPACSSSSVLSLNVIAIAQLPEPETGGMPASPLLHPPPWSSPGSPRSPSPPSSYIPAGDPAAPVTHPSTPLILFPHLSQFKTLGSVPQTSCREPNFLTHSARARPGLATVPPGVSQGLVYSRYSTNASRRTGERMDVFMYWLC